GLVRPRLAARRHRHVDVGPVRVRGDPVDQSCKGKQRQQDDKSASRHTGPSAAAASSAGANPSHSACTIVVSTGSCPYTVRCQIRTRREAYSWRWLSRWVEASARQSPSVLESRIGTSYACARRDNKPR